MRRLALALAPCAAPAAVTANVRAEDSVERPEGQPGSPRMAEGGCVALPRQMEFCPEGSARAQAAGETTEAPLIESAGGVGLVIQVLPAEGGTEAETGAETGTDALRADLNDLAETMIEGNVTGFVRILGDRPEAGRTAVRFASAAQAEGAPEIAALTLAAWPGAVVVVHTSRPGDTYLTEPHAMLHGAALGTLRPAG